MAIKILSVDDELDLEVLLTQYFRRQIRKGEYAFTFAHNGLEALQKMLETPDFDIVLSDINMPEMDGLTLLGKINELKNPALKCIMVSAYGDMGNIRSAMNKGAFDFATKPIDLEDLERSIRKAAEEVTFIRQSVQEHTQLESLKNDLAIAGEIQQAILPNRFPPFTELAGLVDVYASMTPAKDVGGDFYDLFQIDGDRFGFVIADVSGKGVPAALFMAVSRTLLRATGLSGVSSAECVGYVNRLLCKESLEAMFVTGIYGIYDCRTGAVDYTNAGHTPPYIIKESGQAEAVDVETNFVMGVAEDFAYQSGEIRLEPGDALALYTDGVTEAFDTQGEQFGRERLETALRELAGAEDARSLLQGITSRVAGFSKGRPQSDDLTLMVIKRIQ